MHRGENSEQRRLFHIETLSRVISATSKKQQKRRDSSTQSVGILQPENRSIGSARRLTLAQTQVLRNRLRIPGKQRCRSVNIICGCKIHGFLIPHFPDSFSSFLQVVKLFEWVVFWFFFVQFVLPLFFYGLFHFLSNCFLFG
jgi:hypothetical protein